MSAEDFFADKTPEEIARAMKGLQRLAEKDPEAMAAFRDAVGATDADMTAVVQDSKKVVHTAESEAKKAQ